MKIKIGNTTIEAYFINTKSIINEINNGKVVIFEIPSRNFEKWKGSLITVSANKSEEQSYRIITGHLYKNGESYDLDVPFAEDVPKSEIRKKIESLNKEVKENKGRILFRDANTTIAPDVMGFIEWIQNREKK